MASASLEALVAAVVLCSPVKAKAQEQTEASQLAATAFVDAAIQRSNLKEFNQALTARGYSTLSTNYTSLGFGALLEFPRVGFHAMFEGVTHRTSEGPDGELHFRQFAANFGGFYRLIAHHGISAGPGLGFYVGKHWIENCPKKLDWCSASRSVLGIDMALRANVRLGVGDWKSGPAVTALLGYRAQVAEDDWGREDETPVRSNPPTVSSGAFMRIGMGFWY